MQIQLGSGSDASAAVFTADMCEFCLGSHPFLRKIITDGERFSLSQNHMSSESAVVTTTRLKTKEVNKYVMTVRLLCHYLLSIFKESFPRHSGKIPIKTLRLDANEAFSLRSDFPNPSRLWHTFGTTHKNLGHQTSHLEQLIKEFS